MVYDKAFFSYTTLNIFIFLSSIVALVRLTDFHLKKKVLMYLVIEMPFPPFLSVEMGLKL